MNLQSQNRFFTAGAMQLWSELPSLGSRLASPENRSRVFWPLKRVSTPITKPSINRVYTDAPLVRSADTGSPTCLLLPSRRPYKLSPMANANLFALFGPVWSVPSLTLSLSFVAGFETRVQLTQTFARDYIS